MILIIGMVIVITIMSQYDSQKLLMSITLLTTKEKKRTTELTVLFKKLTQKEKKQLGS